MPLGRSVRRVTFRVGQCGSVALVSVPGQGTRFEFARPVPVRSSILGETVPLGIAPHWKTPV